MENDPTRIIWHHTGVPGKGNQFEGVNNAHRDREFPKSRLGYYGGYHILIEKSGQIRRFRGDDEVGAHTRDHNAHTLGIAMAGNFETEHPTQAQVASFAQQLREWRAKWNIPLTGIFPHRAMRATLCPGTNLADDWPDKLPNTQLRQTNIHEAIEHIEKALKKLNATL